MSPDELRSAWDETRQFFRECPTCRQIVCIPDFDEPTGFCDEDSPRSAEVEAAKAQQAAHAWKGIADVFGVTGAIQKGMARASAQAEPGRRQRLPAPAPVAELPWLSARSSALDAACRRRNQGLAPAAASSCRPAPSSAPTAALLPPDRRIRPQRESAGPGTLGPADMRGVRVVVVAAAGPVLPGRASSAHLTIDSTSERGGAAAAVRAGLPSGRQIR